MPAPIVQLRDLRLTFGGQPLLAGASMQIEPGDRICLVGRNGSGKSTLLRIIAGEIAADSGERFVHPGATLRYLPQQPDIAGHVDVAAYVAAGLGPADDHSRGRQWLEELGLDAASDPARLSGGEARRAALVRALAADPDLLLLDEPTNHLDLPAIEWLEARLAETKAGVVVVSHDRRFLERISDKTVWLDRGRTRAIDKGFAEFESWRDELLDAEADEARKLDRKIEREEHWLRHGVSGRRRRNMRRLEELAQLRRRRAETRGPAGALTLAGSASAGSAGLIAELQGVSKGFGGREVVRNLSLIVKRGDRLGIVGPNGAGKTTLVRILTGELAPDSGSVRRGQGLQVLTIDQNRTDFDPARSLRDTLTDGAGDTVTVAGKARHVVGYLQDFQFLPEQAGTPVGKLSGGERARLALARGLARPSNVLVLDEPTNDLDLETLDVLQEFLSDYAGTILLVSHDRDFLDRICTSVVASTGDGIWREHAGGYSDMIAQQRGEAREPPNRARPTAKPVRAVGRAPLPQDRSATRLSYKQKYALQNLPDQIDALHGRIVALRAELADPGLFARDRLRFDAASVQLAEAERDLAAREDQWLELELLRETIEREAAGR